MATTIMAARGDVRLTLRTSFSLLLGAGNLRIRPMVLMLAAAFACELNAQGLPNAGQVLDSLHELQQIPSRPESESLQFDLPAPAKILPPAGNDATGDRRLTIKSFQLEGNTLFSDETLQMLLADGLDKPLTLRQTEYLVARLGAYYRERGYVLASAYIPQQQISDGRMRVVIMEGVLGEVKLAIAPGVRLSPSRIARVMAALPAGQPIHVPTVERVLLLLNDMPGISVRSTLQAGSSKGSADLVVNVTQTGIGRGWMGIDNFGSRYTGTLRASAGVQLNDLLGIGDQLSLVGIHAFDDINSMRADYEFPLGAEGMRLRFGYSRTAYGIGDVFAPLGLTGKVEAASVGLQYPLLRSRERNLGLFAGTEYRRMAENTAAFGVDVNKNVTNGTFGLRGNAVDGWLRGGISAFQVAATYGRLQRRSAADIANDDASARSAGGFTKLNWQLNRFQQLTPDWSLNLGVSGQFATTNLDSSEKFYLGGPSAVRAYASGEGAGDEGVLGSAEFRYRLPVSMPTQLFGFVDAGRVRINKSPWNNDANYRSLGAFGVGVNWDIAGLGSLRAVYATKANSEQPASQADRRDRIWVSLTATPEALLGAGGLFADKAAGFVLPDDPGRVEVYGTINTDFEIVSRRGATAAGDRGATQSAAPTGVDADTVYRQNSNASNIGFRGSENIGNGLRTWYQIESSLSLDTGAGTFAGRNTGFAIESNDGGTLLAGQWDTPYKRSTGSFDPFDGNQVAAFYNVLGTPGFGVTTATQATPMTTANSTNNDDASFTRRQGKSLQYWSPQIGPFAVKVGYSDSGNAISPLSGEPSLWSTSLTYSAGNLMLIAAYEQHVNYYGIASLGRNNRGVGSTTGPVNATSSRDSGVKLGANYKFPATSVGKTELSLVWERLRYQEEGVIPAATVVDLQSYQRDVFWFGFDHKYMQFEFMGSVGIALPGSCSVIVADATLRNCNTDGLGATMLSLGVQYQLSRRTALYTQYAQIRNRESASYNFSTGYIGGGGVGSDPRAFGVGMIHRF